MSNQATYTVLLGSAIRAAIVVLLAKLLSVIIIANLEGATVELKTFAAVVPYLAISSGPEIFLDISTHSTLVMALAAVLYLAPCVARPDTPTQVTWGRLVGMVIAAETLAVQTLIHYLGVPNVRVDRVWWIVLVLLAALLLGAAGLGFTARAPRADPEHASAVPL